MREEDKDEDKLLHGCCLFDRELGLCLFLACAVVIDLDGELDGEVCKKCNTTPIYARTITTVHCRVLALSPSRWIMMAQPARPTY